MSRTLIFILIMLHLLSCGEKKQTEIQETPPNVILIFTDDQGYQDLGSFGSPNIATPHLDTMAMEGVKMTSFYAAQAVCSASRAGILTGCYPNRIGIHNAYMPNAKTGLNTEETTLAEMLRSIGYRTAMYGKWHLGDNKKFMPNNQGFEDYFGIPYSNDMWPLHPQQGPVFNFGPLPLYENEKILDTLTDQSELTTQITERSVAFIEKNKEEPFFLYVAHPQPHVPLYVSEKFKGKSERGLYGDVIMEIDWSVGQIMETLKKNGLEENTVIIFTSDNGPWLAYGNHAGSALPFREGKGTAWEGGQREPFIIKYPKRLSPGRTLDTPIMAIDILPTIAEITGAPLPQLPIDGKSVWSLLTGDIKEGPQEAYFFYYRVNELHGVRYGKWKMYFPHTYRTMNGQTPGKNGLPGEYKMIHLQEIELYDVVADNSETNNVAAKHPEVVKKIRKLANTMRQKLGDSLLELEGTENREVGRVD